MTWLSPEALPLSDDFRVRARLERLISAQEFALSDSAIVSAPNRQGLREKTGQALEAAFIDLCVSLKPDVSVEIGAHEASFSERLKRRHPDIEAIAFEANPLVHAAHADRLAQTGLAIDYRNCAVAAAVGKVSMHIPVRQNGVEMTRVSAITSLHRRRAEGFEYEVIEVPSTTLDETLNSIGPCSAVVWIDAEGAQEQIIAGANAAMTNITTLYIEVENALVWHSQRMDTEISAALHEYNLIPLMRDNLSTVQYNQVFIRNDISCLDIALPIASEYVEQLRRLGV
jgi:FkbM family methyltransferase